MNKNQHQLFVKVKHHKTIVDLEVTQADTVTDLQNRLQLQFHVSVTKQRLLFARGANKHPHGSTLLRDLEGLCTSQPSPSTAPAVLLIGIPETALHLVIADGEGSSGAPTAAVSTAAPVAAAIGHLVAVTKETKEGLYMCSYPNGYAAQDAHVCRTCIDQGVADVNHAVCGACAEVCHSGHDVEFYGHREYMRCDCCTERCWADRSAKTDPSQYLSHACQFIVDDRTGNPPPDRQPTNNKNIYPRPGKWCYCRSDTPYPKSETDPAPTCCSDMEPDYGCCCLLCNTCFWSPHLTHLHTSNLSSMPCYGEVCSGPIVAFKCTTCDTLVCPPCRLRCHRDHVVEDEPVYPSNGEDSNGAPADCEFSCGCRGNCAIAEAVPASSASEEFSVSREVAMELNDSDVFVSFICAYCMQDYPWLASNSLSHCYNGELPGKSSLAHAGAVVPCGDLGPVQRCDVESSTAVFPFHGMLVPKQIFSKEASCPCSKCEAAFAAFHRRRYIPLTTFVPSGFVCSHCDADVGEMNGGNAFLCTTCELSGAPSFLLCHDCYNRREEVGVQHETGHEFIQDTFDNIWNVFGASLVRHVDPSLQQWMTEHWHESRDVLFDLLRGSFTAKRLREGRSAADGGDDDEDHGVAEEDPDDD